MKAHIDEYTTEEEKRQLEDEQRKATVVRLRIREIMETEGFEELIKILLDISNFNGNNYTEVTQRFYHMEGRRSVFSDVLAVLEDCDPTYYPRLLLRIAEDVKNARGNDSNTD